MLFRSRHDVAGWYHEGLPRVRFQESPIYTSHAHWAVSGLMRHDPVALAHHLRAHGIDSRPVFPPMHWMPMYRTAQRFPVAEALHREGLVLPTHAQLTSEDVARVCAVIKGFHA